MDTKKIIQYLRTLSKPPKDLPDWPLFKPTIQALLDHPEEAAQYMDDRLNKRFATRQEIGDHLRHYTQVLGLPASNMNHMNLTLGLQTLRPQAALDREAAALEVKANRIHALAAAAASIAGYGSPQALEPEYGVGYMTIYKVMRRLLKEEHLGVKDLSYMTSPKRKALAAKLERQELKRIESHFERQLFDK